MSTLNNQYLDPKSRFSINGKIYKVSDEELEYGDYMLHILTGEVGICQGQTTDMVSIKDNHCTYSFLKRNSRKLVLDRDATGKPVTA